MSPERPVGLDAIPTGQRGAIRLPADLSQDHQAALVVHVIRGSRTGPSLAIVATAHGDEWGSIEPIRRFLSELDPNALRGRVLAVPVAQPRALSSGSRNAPGEPDHNRVLPGGGGSSTERLVETLARGVLAESDAVLDFHGGGWAQLPGCVTYGNDYPNAGTTDACKAMARAFGWPYLRATPAVSAYPGLGSVLGWVGSSLDRPVAMVNLGGPGFGAEWDERWTLAQLRGLRNTLRHFEMLPGRLELPARFLHFSACREVLAPAGGLLMPRVGTDHLGGRFDPGEPLGDLWDAESLDRIATLSSPCRGVLYSLRGSGPVAAEAACFALADLDAPDTIWENAA